MREKGVWGKPINPPPADFEQLRQQRLKMLQNLNNKYKRNTFKISELEKVADALDANLVVTFVDKETGEPII